jgi:plastocyanin
MRMLAGSAAVLTLLFATACGGGGAQDTSGPGATTAPGATIGGGATTAPDATTGGAGAAASCEDAAAGSGPVISMEGTHSLNPSDETISVGDAVTWTNNSKTNHQISFSGGPTCGFTLIGKSVSITFDTPGSFAYVCKIHPTFMKGTITVQ